MPSSAPLLEPGFSVRFAEQGLAQNYSRFTSAGEARDAVPEVEVIRLTAVLLEVMLVGACSFELLHEHPAQVGEQEFLTRVQDRCNLDVAAVYADARKYLPPPPVRTGDSSVSLTRLVKVMRTLLDVCPIDPIESVAANHQLEGWGHRARVAFEAIQSFVLRNDPAHQHQMRLAGEKYERGILDAPEVATFLRIKPEDASFFLEAHGYARSTERILLDADARDEILGKIRRRRLEPHEGFSNQYPIYQEVVASERLEGVDARSWIRRERAG